MRRRWRVGWVVAVATAVVAGGPIRPTGGGGGDGGHLDTYAVGVDRTDFTTEIDNPFLPLRPGNRWVYEGVTETGGAVRTVIEVTSATRRVMGVDCVVVRDTMSVDGKVVEDTFDWYAQDVSGNVWYFGENGMKYDGGRPFPDPRDWEAGVAGARPGIAMKAAARVGDRYRQEYNPDKEEAFAEVLSIDELTESRLGVLHGVLMVREFAPSDPDVVEQYFAPGIGMVRAISASGSATAELVEMIRR